MSIFELSLEFVTLSSLIVPDVSFLISCVFLKTLTFFVWSLWAVSFEENKLEFCLLSSTTELVLVLLTWLLDLTIFASYLAVWMICLFKSRGLTTNCFYIVMLFLFWILILPIFFEGLYFMSSCESSRPYSLFYYICCEFEWSFFLVDILLIS